MKLKKIIKAIAEKTHIMFFWNVYKIYKLNGSKKAYKIIKNKVSNLFISNKKLKSNFLRKIESIIDNIEKDQKVIISLSFIDWDIPLFQRPQHLALQLANKGIIYFYCTLQNSNLKYFIEKQAENLYVLDEFDIILEKVKNKDKYLHVLSTNYFKQDTERIEKAISLGYKIIYEYIDEISEDITGEKIENFVFERHKKLLKDESNCIVIATADKLYQEVLKYRQKNCKLITNGVNVNHFRDNHYLVPKNIRKITSQNKTIIGYYGALAKWIDYKLLSEIAAKRNDWNIVLLGVIYDQEIYKSDIIRAKNVYILPPVHYNTIPTYGKCFDVCIIPFKINDITKSTSPIKLFEYMALGKPIVTTPMPECKKYKSVYIADNRADDFIEKINLALKNNNKRYQKLLEKEALENDWSSKADEIINIISRKL